VVNPQENLSIDGVVLGDLVTMRPRSYTVRIEWVRLVIAWVMISNRLVDMFCAQLVGSHSDTL